jgi:hypothetical protein
MSQQVKLPDGTVANFPDGMPAAEMEAVIQKQFPVQREEFGIAKRLLEGFNDPVYGAAQMADRFLVDPIRQAISPGATNMQDVMRQRNAEYVAPDDGLDMARMVGNVANPMAYMGPNRGVAALAGTGMVAGAAQPTEAGMPLGDYAQQKAMQMGLGGAVGAAVGAAAPYSSRMAERVLGKIDNLSAAAPERIARPTDRMAEFVSDAEALGLRVPASIRRESQAMENVGLTLESSPLTSWAVPQTAAHNAGRLSQMVKDATGIADDAALTPAGIRAAERQTGQMFRELADTGTAAITKDEARSAILDNIADSFVGRAKFEKKVDTLIKDFKNDSLSGNDLIRIESSLGDLARKAKGDQRAQIGAGRDALLELIPANPGAGESFLTARSQWAAQRALLDSIGQRGVVSAARLSKRLRVSDANRDTPIGQLARAAEAINYMRPSSYGTENARRGGLTGTVMTGAGGAAGLGWLLGN